MLTSLPYDVICEVLAYLSVPDILRVRRVCKGLSGMTRERTVWSAAYEHFGLLTRNDFLYSQSSDEIEEALVRSSKLSLRWKGHPNPPPPVSSFCLPDGNPTFSFEAGLVAGRYLLTMESRRLCLYDLEARLTSLESSQAYWEHELESPCGILCHHTDVRRDVVHIAFTQEDLIIVVKITLSASQAMSEIVAQIPAQFVVKMCLGNGYVFYAEDTSPQHPARLHHIQTGRSYNISMNELIDDPLDFEDLQIHITENHVTILHSDSLSEACTSIEVYELPRDISNNGSWLRRSHTGHIPMVMAAAEIIDTPSGHPSIPSFTFLALTHGDPDLKPSSQACLLMVILSPSGEIQFKPIASTPVDVDSSNLRQTKLFATSRAGACLAVSCTLASPLYHAYHIEYGSNGTSRIDVSILSLPDADMADRHILGFDGFRGRLCWVRGWCPSQVHVVDYA